MANLKLFRVEQVATPHELRRYGLETAGWYGGEADEDGDWTDRPGGPFQTQSEAAIDAIGETV